MCIFLTDFSSSGRVCLHCKVFFLSGGSGSPCYFATLCDLFLCSVKWVHAYWGLLKKSFVAILSCFRSAMQVMMEGGPNQ